MDVSHKLQLAQWYVVECIVYVWLLKLPFAGRCSTEDLLPRIVQSPADPNGGHCVHGKQVLLLGPLVIAASSDPSLGPTISLLTPTNAQHTLSCQTSRTDRATEVTTLALDQSPPSNSHHARLAAFLSTGDFIVFNVDHSHPTHSSRLLTYQPTLRLPRTAPIVQVVYHGDLLVTLSESFHLSLYHLSGGKVTHTQTLSSFTSYPPSSMVLTPTSTSSYKLVLAYAIPVFPAHWSVGATELIISCGPSMLVTSSRTTRAMDVPAGWIDEQKMRAMREQWSRKVERVADTQTDGKWVILAPSEAPPSPPVNTNTPQGAPGTPPPPSSFKTSSLHSPSSLQLYRLHFPASTSGASNPKLSFVRTLHGQIGPVCATSLADGRCVSLGVNGSIWVWDLEADLGAEVSPGLSHSTDSAFDAATFAKTSVAFDEKRIISSAPHGVELRRFDI